MESEAIDENMYSPALLYSPLRSREPSRSRAPHQKAIWRNFLHRRTERVVDRRRCGGGTEGSHEVEAYLRVLLPEA